MDNVFPDRKELSSKLHTSTYYNNIVEQAKNIDIDTIDFSNANFRPRSEIVEKQKTYFWIRVYLKEEIDLSPDQDVTIEHVFLGEKLTTRFVCFAKKGLDRDAEDQVVNYNAEDDKRILCLMIDSDKINIDCDDIPFIKTLFKVGKWWQPQVMRRDELIFKDSNGNIIDWYDVNF